MTGASLATGNGDRDVLGIGAAVGIVNRDGVDHGDGLARGEEVQLAFRDGVIPVDDAVVGVAGIRADAEGVLDRGLLRTRQGECRGHGLGDFGGRRRIGQVEIGKGDRAGIGEG